MSTATKTVFMGELKQSTAATVYFQVFKDDHQTPFTGIVNGDWTAKKLCKQADSAFSDITPTVSEVGLGWYSLPFTTTHTNTLGILILVLQTAGADDVNYVWFVTTLGMEAASSAQAYASANNSYISVNLDATVSSRATASALATAQTSLDALNAALIIRSGTAQAGSTSSTIKLDAGASATDQLYRGLRVVTTGGTGAGQSRYIQQYVGSTKVATVDHDWEVTPDNTTTFKLEPAEGLALLYMPTDVWEYDASGSTSGSAGDRLYNVVSTDVANAVWEEPLAGHTTAGTAGEQLANARYYIADQVWEETLGDHSGTANSTAAAIDFIYGGVNATLQALCTRFGTCQAGSTANDIKLDAGASATNNLYKGQIVHVYSGIGAGQARWITSYTGGTRVASVSSSWEITPDNTSKFVIISLAGWVETDALSNQIATLSDNVGSQVGGDGLWDANTGVAGLVLNAVIASYISSGTVAEAIDQARDYAIANASAIATVNADTDNIQSRLPAALDGSGNIKAQVKGMDADTVNASALAGDAVTEIVNSIFNYAHEVGRSFKGLVRGLEAVFFGKAVGLNGASVQVYRTDGTTVAADYDQDPGPGDRDAADVTGRGD